MNKTLEQKRDELAIMYDPNETDSFYAFKDGFEAGITACAQKIEKLERALESIEINDGHDDHSAIARKALRGDS